MSTSSASAYPSLDPMPGYPSFGEISNDYSVPTKGSTGGKSLAYPSFGEIDSYSMPVEKSSSSLKSGPKYVSSAEAAYPSLDGISHNRFHEEIRQPEKSKKKEKSIPSNSYAYPTFDDGGNIVSDELEPIASVQMPYSGIKMSKPDKELTFEECCLFCNLLNLFVTYEYDESNVLTPSHVRQALDSITGNNEIYGFSKGQMA